MKKLTITQIIRHIIQLAAFIFIPGLFILVLSSAETLLKALIGGTFQLAANRYQIIVLLAVLPVTMLFGRFFCGYLCAFGSMQELMAFIGRKLHIKEPRIEPRTRQLLKKLKYAVLIALVCAWAARLNYSALSPWNVFGIYSSPSAWTDLSSLLSVGGLILFIIILASLFFERPFCSYLCPLGAVFEVTSCLRLFGIKKKSNCVKCGKCSRVCPMGIDVCGGTEKHRLMSGECIDCFRCVDACRPASLYTNPKEAAAGTLAAAVISGAYLAGTITPSEPAPAAVTTEAAEETSGQYADGTYTGTGTGFRGDITAEVTVSGGRIESVTIVSSRDDAQFFNRAKSTVISSIIAEQSATVAPVSGATFSSNGIMEAVANALNVEYASPVTETAAPLPTQSATEPAATEPAATESAAQVTGQYSDGTYTGTGTGFRGDITAEVTVSGGRIESITIVSSRDDAQFFNRAKSTVISSIIEQQSPSVTAVSGATFSSNGIMEAVAKALGVEFTNPNSTMNGKHGGSMGGRH